MKETFFIKAKLFYLLMYLSLYVDQDQCITITWLPITLIRFLDIVFWMT